LEGFQLPGNKKHALPLVGDSLNKSISQTGWKKKHLTRIK